MRLEPLIGLCLVSLAGGCKQVQRVEGGSAAPGSGVQPISCSQRQALADHALKQGRKVFAGVKLQQSTAQSELLGSPQLYQGKTVRVEGPVVAMCEAQGCWAALEGPTGKRINLKVNDGEVDFRKLATKGVYAVGEGTFSQQGHHGAQVHISGARIGQVACR